MNKDEQQLEEYLRDLEAIPQLPEEEIRQLIASRSTILQQIVKTHLHLVVPITEEFKGQGINQIDLLLKGNLGLIHAVETFDPNSQETFSAYASQCIRAAIAQSQTGG